MSQTSKVLKDTCKWRADCRKVHQGVQPQISQPDSCCNNCLHNQWSSAQTIRNREAHLHAHCTHQGQDLTVLSHRKQFEWASAHIHWHLALWRGVPLMDKSVKTALDSSCWISANLPVRYWLVFWFGLHRKSSRSLSVKVMKNGSKNIFYIFTECI